MSAACGRDHLKLRGCDYPTPPRQRLMVHLRLRTVTDNPSLTRRVLIIPSVVTRLIFRSAETRNFKTVASGCDTGNFFRDCSLLGSIG